MKRLLAFLSPEVRNPFEGFDQKRLLYFVLLVAAVLTIAKLIFHHIVWKVAGPIALVIGLTMVWIYIRRNNQSWSDFGLISNRWRHTLSWFLISFIVMFFVLAFAHLVAGQFFERTPRTNPRFGDLEGDLPMTLVWVTMGIGIGGFAEEMMYRGFFINALERVFNRRLGILLAIILPALFWAVRHYYFSGAYGSVIVFFFGLFFGAVYVLNGRNLWPTILLHGLVDTASFLMRYFGLGGE